MVESPAPPPKGNVQFVGIWSIWYYTSVWICNKNTNNLLQNVRKILKPLYFLFFSGKLALHQFYSVKIQKQWVWKNKAYPLCLMNGNIHSTDSILVLLPFGTVKWKSIEMVLNGDNHNLIQTSKFPCFGNSVPLPEYYILKAILLIEVTKKYENLAFYLVNRMWHLWWLFLGIVFLQVQICLQ